MKETGVRVITPSPPYDESGEEPFVREMADTLERIAANYDREGAGPGSRFEGQRLGLVQARYLVRRIREHDGH